jgi:Zn-dependent protease
MSGWSINLFRVRGIMISLHFTFFLLLAWVAYSGWQEDGVAGLLWSAGFLVAVFLCVVLHEFGHAFMAMRFGIGTSRVLVTLIGGIALLDSIPRKPIQEFLIAAAGPAVNVVIATILWITVGTPDDWQSFAITTPVDALRLLLEANVILLLFNLIPAFPMDGGRMLRALLATQMSYVRATFWAVTVAKVLLAIGILESLFTGNYRRTFICLFIFSAGEAEYRAVKRREDAEAEWRAAMIQRVVSTPAGGPAPGEPPVLNG